MSKCANKNIGNSCTKGSKQAFDELSNCCLVDCDGYATRVEVVDADTFSKSTLPGCFTDDDLGPDGDNPHDVPIQPFSKTQSPTFNARALALNFEVLLEKEAKVKVKVNEDFVSIFEVNDKPTYRLILKNGLVPTRTASSMILKNKRVAMDLQSCRRSNCAVRVTIKSSSNIRATIIRQAKQKLTRTAGYTTVFQVDAVLAHRVEKRNGSEYIVIFKFKDSYLAQ